MTVSVKALKKSPCFEDEVPWNLEATVGSMNAMRSRCIETLAVASTRYTLRRIHGSFSRVVVDADGLTRKVPADVEVKAQRRTLSVSAEIHAHDHMIYPC